MPTQTIPNFQAPRLSGLPVVSSQSPEGTLYRGLSQAFSTIAEVKINDYKAAQVELAARKGKTAGFQSEDLELYQGISAPERAYNRAALESYTNKLQFNGALQLNKLSTQNINNPSAFLQSSNDYINGLSSQLQKNPEVFDAISADVLMDLKLKQNTYLNKISIDYAKQQKTNFKDETDFYTDALESGLYEISSDLYSDNMTARLNAYEQYTLGKTMLLGKMHELNVDGTPMYESGDILKKMQKFDQNFFKYSIQNYARQNNLTSEQIGKVIDGTVAIDLMDSSGKMRSISIIDKIGADRYKTDVVDFVLSEERRKQVATRDNLVIGDKLQKKAQDYNFFVLSENILSKNPGISTSTISNSVRNGQLSPDDGRAALKILLNPPAEIEDQGLVADLISRQVSGQDISPLLKQNINNLTKETYQDLSRRNAQLLEKTSRDIDTENEKFLRDQVVQKSPFGIESPVSIRTYSDIVQNYRQMRKDGMTPELAYSKSVEYIDYVKREDPDFIVKTPIPLYLKMMPDNTIDIKETAKSLNESYLKGQISTDVYTIEIEKLKKLQAETEKVQQP